MKGGSKDSSFIFFFDGEKGVCMKKAFWSKTGYMVTSLEAAIFYLTEFTDRGVIFQMTTRKASDGKVIYMFATNANKYMAETLETIGIVNGCPITVDV